MIGTAQKSFRELCATDLMSRNVVMIPAEMSLPAAARILSRSQISGAPVVDAEGRCVGILSATDYLHLAEHDGPRPPSAGKSCTCKPWQIVEGDEAADPLVCEVMTRDLVRVNTQTDVRTLAKLMVDAHIHRVIVVDRDNRPVGVISSTDILAAVARMETSL